jgi:hypothetical protein
MNTLVERSEATAVDVSFTSDSLGVVLSDGRVVSVPLAWFPRLLKATLKQRKDWEFIGGGIGIHWEGIDEDISTASLLHPENYMRLPEVPELSATPRRRAYKSKPPHTRP